MCVKQKHEHKIQAQGHILSLHKDYGIDVSWMKVYKCPICLFYHIARKKKFRKLISVIMNQYKAHGKE